MSRSKCTLLFNPFYTQHVAWPLVVKAKYITD